MWICPECKSKNQGAVCPVCQFVYRHSEIVDPKPEDGVILNVGAKEKNKKTRNQRKYADKLSGEVIISKPARTRKLHTRTKVIIALGALYFIVIGAFIAYHMFFKQKPGNTPPLDDPFPHAGEQDPENPDPSDSVSPGGNGIEPDHPPENPDAPDGDFPDGAREDGDGTPEDADGEDHTPEEAKVTIGISSYGEVSTDNAAEYNIPRGVMVFEVLPDSPAQRAGLKYGDVIVKYNGTTVLYGDDIQLLKEGGYEGDQAILTIYRPNVGEFTVTITLS